jgi:RimJ/RimL family protein N-acetyltransferase
VNNPFLIGNAVYLRALEREDAQVMLPWFNDPEITRTLLRHRPINRGAEEAFIDGAGREPDDIVLGVVLKHDDRLVGVTGLRQFDHKNRHASFGITLDKVEWNKGYGTETTHLIVAYGFETLNLNRIWLHVVANNARGIRTYEKVGFQKEGVLRQDDYREGRYWDTVVMAILREEWGSLPEPR